MSLMGFALGAGDICHKKTNKKKTPPPEEMTKKVLIIEFKYLKQKDSP